MGRFCVRGHDTAVVGRKENRQCIGCYPKFKKKQFCSRGHDTFSLGRNGNGGCRRCAQIRDEHRLLTKEQVDQKRLNSIEYEWRSRGVLSESGSFFTMVDFDRHYQVQAGKCAGCGRHQSELNGKLHVDHDHATGKFRKLLCGGCNRICGLAHDSPAVLRTLAGLLEVK